MIRVLDSAGSTLVEWGRQQQQHGVTAENNFIFGKFHVRVKVRN